MSFPNVFSSITANYNDRFYHETLAADEDLLPIYRCCYLLQPGTYSGDTLAAEIQAALVRSGKGDPNPTVTFLATGELNIRLSDSKYAILIPSMAQLKDPAFLATTWLAPTSATLKDGDNTLPYSSNLRAANATLNMPTNDGTSPNFNTGVINLAPIQQLYVHCNITDYSSLTATGSQDVLAVIQVTENYGNVVHFIEWSALDSQAIRFEEGLLSTIRFTFTDRAGTPVPFPSTANLYICADSFGAAYLYKKENGSPLAQQGGESREQRRKGSRDSKHGLADRQDTVGRCSGDSTVCGNAIIKSNALLARDSNRAQHWGPPATRDSHRLPRHQRRGAGSSRSRPAHPQSY
jgi:hypothetical protein